jgi:predicted signal transduction protein with EAL and GGDEF domain
VETERQLRFLAAQGCDEVQGYLFAVPMSAEAFEAFAGRHDPDRVRAMLRRDDASATLTLRQAG